MFIFAYQDLDGGRGDFDVVGSVHNTAQEAYAALHGVYDAKSTPDHPVAISPLPTLEKCLFDTQNVYYLDPNGNEADPMVVRVGRCSITECNIGQSKTLLNCG